MAVRRFNGTTDYIRASIGACNITEAISMAAFIRPTAATSRAIIALHNSSNQGKGYEFFIDPSGHLGLYNGGAEIGSPVAIDPEEGWVFVAATKAAGTKTVTYYKYVFETGEWTVYTTAGTLGNASAVTGGTVRFGEYQNDERFKGDWAAAGLWDKQLSEAEVKALAETAYPEPWSAGAGAKGAWLFNQAEVSEAVADITGNGANQSAISGTEVIAEEPPAPYEEPTLWEGDELAKFTQQEKEEDRIVVSPDLVCPGTTHSSTFKIETRDEDWLSEAEEKAEPPTTRAEIYADKPPLIVATDVVRWFRFQFLFPDDYDTTDTTGFRDICQLKPSDNSNPNAFTLATRGTDIYWKGSFGEKVADLRKNVWYDVILEAKLSDSAEEGPYQKLYVNDELAAERGADFLLPEGIGYYDKWGYYKQASVPGGSVYIGGIAVATTREQLGPAWAPTPDVTTLPATGITPVKATLNGSVDPNGLPTTYYFEYGETEAYGTKVPASEDGDAGEGSEAVAVSEAISGLKPHTTYHFRLVAENEEGEVAGEDASFTTERPIRVAVTREFPPDRLAVRIADPSTGATIARWAEDEHRAENILNGLTKSGEMPGGHKEAGGSLPRDPRVDWPDLDTYMDIFIEGAGGEDVWNGRLNEAPESDGERMVVEPKAVGHQAALEDRKGLRLGFIDQDLSKWGDPSTARRLKLIEAAIDLVASTSVGFSSVDPEAAVAAVINDFTNTEKREGHGAAGEAVYSAGGIDIGQVPYDYDQLTAFAEDANWESQMALGSDDVFSSYILGTDHNRTDASQQSVSAGGASGYKYARLRDSQNGPTPGPLFDVTAWKNLKVLSLLAVQSLSLQGTWPNVGYTAKQMLELAVPLYSYLETDDEGIEDDGYVIPQAWYSDPGPLSNVVTDLTKYSLLDWFVMDGKRFEVRFPGTYGRKWQASTGASELKETGEDGSRLWDRLVVSYQDVDGTTRTVGYPGSDADTESEALQITDPDHPAVKAGKIREDLLALKGISTAQRALEAGERWLEEGNELSHAGTATLRGYIQDSATVFRPVSQVQPGDELRFVDAGSNGTGYRKIVAVSYSHDERAAAVTLDAPPRAVEALLERFNAALVPLGL